MNAVLPIWIELLVAFLLICTGLFALFAAWGTVRLQDFFQRMHPPALLTTAASWCITLASVIYFTQYTGHLALKTWLIIIMLSISAPISAMMLARAALFRNRQTRPETTPPPLMPRNKDLT